ncbi:TPA: hypothetical protein ACHVEN_002342, partial [Streptococcus suis]
LCLQSENGFLPFLSLYKMYELRLFRLLSVMLLLGSLFLFKKNQKMAGGRELGSKSIIYTQ